MKVVELFAGVGGFRIGLEKASSKYKTVLANQWEPSTKIQHAANVYRKQFGNDVLVNEDINVLLQDNYSFPDHDLLVGGFPCQDFSVANSLSRSKGLDGMKGNLWFSILKVIDLKRPKYCLFENVNRLLQSPAIRRGRDFAYMLSTLNERGYSVEWMVVDASEYGFPQKRKRVFFLCYRDGSKHHKNSNMLANTFPFKMKGLEKSGKINKPNNVYKKFNLAPEDVKSAYLHNSKKPFMNYGVFTNQKYNTFNFESDYDGKLSFLKDVIVNDVVDKEFYVSKKDLKKWKYEKGGYTNTRTTKEGFTYDIKFGKMDLYDELNEPSRTIITGEGGKTASRMKHLITTPHKYKRMSSRRLIPMELERLNMFPDNFTKLGLNEKGKIYELSNSKRAFLMGNAMVTGIVEQLARKLLD